MPAGLAAMAVTTCSVALATPGTADPRCDGQSCVPGVGHGAEMGAPCANTERYIFSTTSSGDLVACAYAGSSTPSWVGAAPLVGVRDEYSPCPSGISATAQSPDGFPMLCVSDGSGSGSYWQRSTG